MKVKGLGEEQLSALAKALELELWNFRRVGRFYAFRLVPASKLYRRRGRYGWIKATCFHGFRDYIRSCFRAGAEEVRTVSGIWRSLEDFEADLGRLARINVGTLLEPLYMINTCNHGGIDALVMPRLSSMAIGARVLAK